MLRSHEVPGEAIKVPHFKPRQQRRSQSAPPASRVLGGDSVQFRFAGFAGFGSSDGLPAATTATTVAAEDAGADGGSNSNSNSTIKEKDFVL
jgi:hypothetical protein